MRPIKHQCSNCGTVDEIPAAQIAGCPACLAEAGSPCVSLIPGRDPKPIAVAHRERLAIARQMDRARTGRSGLRIVEMV